MTCCPTCLAFIHDWLILPQTPDEPVHVRWKTIVDHADEIAPLLYRVIMTLTDRQRRSVESIYKSWVDTGVATETHAGPLLVDLIGATIRPDETYDLLSFMETICTTRAGAVESWISVWILRMWTTLYIIHKEHSKQQEVSECAAAPGLRRLKRKTNGSVVLETPSFAAGICSTPRDEEYDVYAWLS